MQPFFYFTAPKTPNQKVSVLWKGTFLYQARQDFSFSFPQQKTKLHSSYTDSLTSSLVQEKNKQTKMCSPRECPKITRLLASRKGCWSPRPDCNRGKTSCRHENEPAQTRRWTRANYTLRYRPSHRTEAHICAIWERLMQAGTGFNEHWVSHHVLQKRNSQQSQQHVIALKQHNRGEGQLWLRWDCRRGKSGTTPNRVS